MAEGEGIQIHAVAANNDFSCPALRCVRHRLLTCAIHPHDRGHGGKDICGSSWRGGASLCIRNWLPMTSWRIYGQSFTRSFPTEEIWAWCREALIECARYAGDAGVTLALQNHRP